MAPVLRTPEKRVVCWTRNLFDMYRRRGTCERGGNNENIKITLLNEPLVLKKHCQLVEIDPLAVKDDRCVKTDVEADVPEDLWPVRKCQLNFCRLPRTQGHFDVSLRRWRCFPVPRWKFG